LPSLFETSTTKPSLFLPPNILRDYLAIRQEEKCLFCQLILSTFHLNFTSHAFSGKTIAAKFETFAQRGVLPGFGRHLWITGPEPEKDKSQVTLSGVKSDYGYCIQSTAQNYSLDWPANPTLQARQVDQHRVDLRLVRSWLDLCRDCHSGDCAPGQRIARSQFGLRVIDVIHERVVDAPADCKYVDLSYVRGQAKQVMNRKDTRLILTTPGGLCSLEIPRTTRDATNFRKVLGENHLWVDALCIQQDDGEDVRSQIANMDQVYSCAEFTIVAAAGDRCNMGLPGLNGSRNFIQHTADIWGTRLITTHRSPTLGAEPLSGTLEDGHSKKIFFPKDYSSSQTRKSFFAAHEAYGVKMYLPNAGTLPLGCPMASGSIAKLAGRKTLYVTHVAYGRHALSLFWSGTSRSRVIFSMHSRVSLG
jgi:hypothetical protein